MKGTQGNSSEKLGKTNEINNEMHEQWKVHKEIVAKN